MPRTTLHETTTILQSMADRESKPRELHGWNVDMAFVFECDGGRGRGGLLFKKNTFFGNYNLMHTQKCLTFP